MIFVVIGIGEAGPISRTCETAAAALEQARRLNEQGIRDVLIDADGQEYAPAAFNRLFIAPERTEVE